MDNETIDIRPAMRAAVAAVTDACVKGQGDQAVAFANTLLMLDNLARSALRMSHDDLDVLLAEMGDEKPN
jgi:hypothetical protein